MRSQTPYDPLRDYSPITLVGSSPMVMVIHPSVVATSVKELIALAKAKPGELDFASGPSGAIPHQDIVSYLQRNDIKDKFLAASTEIVAGTPRGLTDTMRSEMARMGKVIKAARIRVE